MGNIDREGFNQLVNIGTMSIQQMATDILKRNHAWCTILYGNGITTKQICDVLLS